MSVLNFVHSDLWLRRLQLFGATEVVNRWLLLGALRRYTLCRPSSGYFVCLLVRLKGWGWGGGGGGGITVLLVTIKHRSSFWHILFFSYTHVLYAHARKHARTPLPPQTHTFISLTFSCSVLAEMRNNLSWHILFFFYMHERTHARTHARAHTFISLTLSCSVLAEMGSSLAHLE